MKNKIDFFPETTKKFGTKRIIIIDEPISLTKKYYTKKARLKMKHLKIRPFKSNMKSFVKQALK